MTTTRAPIAFSLDGEILCPRCVYPRALDAAAVYDHDESGPDGVTCDQCLAVIVPADKLTIWRDDDPPHPRTDWDVFGTFYVPAGNRYVTGDDDAADPRDLNPEEVAVCLPVYAYVHGGVALSTGAFGCPWDSGQVGAIYATVADVVKCYGADTPAARRLTESCLHGEIETLATYYRGDIYGYTFEQGGEVVDSCGGFYGLDTLADELPERARALYDAGDYTERHD